VLNQKFSFTAFTRCDEYSAYTHVRPVKSVTEPTMGNKLMYGSQF
jgi:hypothetical protein